MSVISYDHLHTLFKSHLESKLNKHKNNISTYYGKTDFTFLISSDSWTCFGTPSFNFNFMSFESTPGIAPKCRTKKKKLHGKHHNQEGLHVINLDIYFLNQCWNIMQFRNYYKRRHVFLKDQGALNSHVKTS